jgi:hypothetical protein
MTKDTDEKKVEKLSLSARIAARGVSKKNPSPYVKNRTVFLALRPEIQGALDDGWNIKIIWDTLHEEGKVNFGYQAFRRYVNSLILSPQPSSDATAGKKALPDQTKSSGDKKQNKPIATGFTFNNNPNKEDLI